jgi:hypothetical protein
LTLVTKNVISLGPVCGGVAAQPANTSNPIELLAANHIPRVIFCIAISFRILGYFQRAGARIAGGPAMLRCLRPTFFREPPEPSMGTTTTQRRVQFPGASTANS